MNLYEAIYARRSVRKFCMEPVDDKIIDGMFQFLEESEPLFPEITVSVRVYPSQKQKPKLSGFANVSAPHYLVIYTEKKEKSEMNAGYIMQKLALYLTSRGVGSCYQGMAKKRDAKLEADGLSCAMVMAFGYPKNQGKSREAKRLPMEELCALKSQPRTHTKELLEAARLAPSSFNSQPWRFVVYENRFHVFSRKPVGGRHRLNKHDEFNFGVMLANVMEAAEELWIDVELIKLDNITHIELPNNQYVISALLE